MTTSRLAGLSLLFVSAFLAGGCISYHRAGPSYSATHASYEGFVYGSTVRLGGGYYQVAYHPRSRSYYVRTRRLGPHRRYCTDFCFQDRGHTFHHAGCRHLGRHLRGLGFSVDGLIRRHGPY